MAIEAKRVLKRRGAMSCAMTGVWRAVCYMTGLAVVFHGPLACAHIARRMDNGVYPLHLSDAPEECRLTPVPLFSSGLSEAEAVFGGEDRLCETLRAVAARCRPEAIVLVSSCMAGVIGDDAAAAASRMEAELGLPVLAPPLHGYLDGTYFDGYIAAARMVMERFMEPQAREPGTAILIGDYGGLYGRYAREVKRLLAYFDVRVTAQFPAYMTLEETRRAPAASLAIVLGRSIEEESQRALTGLAEEMRARFGTPVIGDVFPVGAERTLRWLSRVGEALGRPEAAARAAEAERRRFEETLLEARKALAGKRVMYCGGRIAASFSPAAALRLAASVGMEVLGAAFFDAYEAEDAARLAEEARRAAGAPVLSGEAAEAALRAADVVLTTHELLQTGLRQVFLPVAAGAGMTTERDVLRAMCHVLRRSPSRGGLIYA